MASQEKKTKREIVVRLADVVEGLIAEQEKIKTKLENVAQLLKLVAENPDIEVSPDDLNMDDDHEVDGGDPQEKEVGNVTYKIGEHVQLLDSKANVWTSTAVLDKFCPKMAKMRVLKAGQVTSKLTRRKYGNFRHIPSP